MLPMMNEIQAGAQAAGGSWAEIFNRSAAVNVYPILTVAAWYFMILAVGTVFYPLTRSVFRGLRDRGWGVSRFFALLLLSLSVWLAAGQGGTFSARTIWHCFAAWAVFSFLVFLRSRREILNELNENRRRILTAELVFFLLFLFFLLIRLGNSDLWHPYKGGEKPMDFSYFNAVIKSTVLPPYDPWFSGGTLNYYYYGFFVSGLLTKWIGIVPSVAYNLILAAWYAFLGIGAFSIGATVYAALRPEAKETSVAKAGAVSVAFLQVFGNLGTYGILGAQTVKLGQEFLRQQGSSPDGIQAFFFGLLQLLRGRKFQLYPGDWYWIPSRAIPGEPITEFPYFTFLYGDPHAHLFALPITVLALAWIVSLIRSDFGPSRISAWRRWTTALIGGGVILGSLIPTNTWDFPTYFLICAGAIVLIAVKPVFLVHAGSLRRVGIAVVSIALLTVVSIGLFYPYLLTNSRETSIQLWTGERTPCWSYLMHWGLFLFAIITWFFHETADWLETVKLSAFRRFYERIRGGLFAAAAFSVVTIGFFASRKVAVGLIAFPLMAWALLLILRADQAPLKRIVLFWIGTALFITLFVEFSALRGDIGRMNMVFKLYNQAWVLLSISSAAAIALTSDRFRAADRTAPGSGSVSGTRTVWRVALAVLVCGGALFTVTASLDKITDRIDRTAPRTLDGMAYMDSANYAQDGFTMDLSQDARAIRWLQDHAAGSPTIVEGHASEYKWGNRITVYTGLPSVVGWNYHQRQQRTMMTEAVWDRVRDVESFYNTTSESEARAFLEKYAVRYLIVGQLERGLYSEAGIAKFEEFDGSAWREVYRDRDTAIYEVMK